eukprot:TRINITY_DN11394_c0_g1_i2.p3 TRINITY_DN11394_c0_g1~~TRINITY_DN11394_c0_g1_i2.p3  ORF type:complete len:103 (+),score=35.85 TRINITY_DN11394_c0_g1_i2:260-568(+)
MVNITLAMAAESYMKSLRNGKLRRPVAFSLALVLILTAVMTGPISTMRHQIPHVLCVDTCLLYTSDAADDTPCVDLGGRRIIKKKNKKKTKKGTQGHNDTKE